jgi:hypothetical protein
MAFLAPHTTPARIFYSLEAASPEECEMLEEWVKINPDLDLNTFYNDDGWTLLLQLVANAPAPHAGHFRIARLLLSHGADINLCHPSICGLAPLHFALKRMTSRLRGGPTDKQLAMINFLIANGADVNQKSTIGTPLSMALTTEEETTSV